MRLRAAAFHRFHIRQYGNAFDQDVVPHLAFRRGAAASVEPGFEITRIRDFDRI
jgi:hypothetical protein